MGWTLEDVKAKLEKNRNATKKKPIFRPKDNHKIRFIWNKEKYKEPIVEVGIHFGVGGESFVCRNVTLGEECPVCDAVVKLRQWTNSNGEEKTEEQRKADWNVAFPLMAKNYYYATIVEKIGKGNNIELSEPKIWKLPQTVFTKIMELAIDEERIEMVGEDFQSVLFGIENGFDFIIDAQQPHNKDGKGNNKKFINYEVKTPMKPSPLIKDKKEIQKLLDSVPDVQDVIPRKSAEEIDALWQKFLQLPDSDGKIDNGEERYFSNSSEKPIIEGKSIEEAFGDLLSKDDKEEEMKTPF